MSSDAGASSDPSVAKPAALLAPPSATPPPASSPRAAKAPPAKVRLPHRVADYFFICGGVRVEQAQERDAQTGSSGASNDAAGDASAAAGGGGKAKRMAWQARMLDRYPRTDFPDAECPKDLEMFCFPSTYEISLLCFAPESHAFVLTEADGTRVFGVCFKFWEALDEERLAAIEAGLAHGWDNAAAMGAASATRSASASVVGGAGSSGSGSGGSLVYAPKCFVLVSHWPFLSNFERFLATLHKCIYIHSHSDQNLVPIERVLTNFICETPLPPQGKFEVECRAFMNPFINSWLNSCPWGAGGSAPSAGSLGVGGGVVGSIEKKVPFTFARPPPNRLPLRDFPLSTLFRWLSLDNILLLFSAVLTERRILFVSDKAFKLTIAAETITYLCCPFFWRHIYIPLLPARLADFICAPMPYIVGVLASYLPDSLMLDGTLVVNLDDNMMVQSSGDPALPLPPERHASLYRHLKRIVADPSRPNPPTHSMPDTEIESAFLKFHTRLMGRYKEYMEAPSEYVIDKFQKARFVAEHPEGGAADKAKGLAGGSGGPGTQWLTEFMETQQFQCFCDDRYDQSTRGGLKALASDANLEILFFDESIDASCGRPSPFLQDSTQNHQPANKVLALLPNTEGLPKGALYKYSTVPIPLNEDLFGVPRHVPDLAGDSASLGGGGGGGKRIDMDKLSMKFFTEKRLYSQHFHTLRLRSAKQDTTANHITAYFKASQAQDEDHIGAHERVCAATVDKTTPETGTTIDPAWNSLKKYVQDELQLYTDSFKAVREEVAVPLYSACSEGEHKLKILFSEANILEAKAAKGKGVVERAKSASLAAFHKYEQMKTALTAQMAVLTPSEISRIVSAQAESEDLRLDLDEAETSFQTILREYETRMPEIIASIRQINQERIVQLRASMAKWVAAKRVVLQGLMQQLERVAARVDDIDAEKDLVSFSEGTTDFWAAARGNKEQHATATATAIAAALPAPSQLDPRAAPLAETTETAADGTTVSSEAAVPTGGSAQPAVPSSSPSPSPATTGTESDANPEVSISGTSSLSALPPAHPGAATGGPVAATTGAPSVGVVGLRHRSSSAAHGALCYPLHLWGGPGFERAVEQLTLTRRVMKELIVCLNQWCEVTDSKSKKLTALMRAVPELLQNPGIGSAQRAVWESLKNRSLTSARSLIEFQRFLLKLVSDLSLSKGELKMSITRFKEHRMKLEKEVAVATDVRAKSADKSEKAQRALQALQRQQALQTTATMAAGSMASGAYPSAAVARAQFGGAASSSSSSLPSDALSPSSAMAGVVSSRALEAANQQLERLSRDCKEALHEHELNERNLVAVQRKHDICISRLLRLFEKKERAGLDQLRKALTALAEQMHTTLIQSARRADHALAQAIKRTDIAADWQEFVEATVARNTAAINAGLAQPSPSPPPPSQPSDGAPSGSVDFGTALGATGYSPVASLLQCSMSFVRTSAALLAELAQADDAEVKLLRKFSFRIRSARQGTTLHTATMAFEQLLERTAEVTDDCARAGADLAAPFAKLKTTLKTHLKTFETRFAEQEKTLRRALDDRKAAYAEEVRAAEALRVARAKVAEAAAAGSGDTPVKKGLFSSFMSTPLRDLQSKETAAARDADKAQLVTQEKEGALLTATARRASELRDLLREMQSTDLKRWTTQSDLFSALTVKHSLHLDKLQTLLHHYSSRAVAVDVDADTKEFLRKHQTHTRAPDYVLDDYSKYVDHAAESERARQAAAAAAALNNKGRDAEKRQSIVVPAPTGAATAAIVSASASASTSSASSSTSASASASSPDLNSSTAGVTRTRGSTAGSRSGPPPPPPPPPPAPMSPAQPSTSMSGSKLPPPLPAGFSVMRSQGNEESTSSSVAVLSHMAPEQAQQQHAEMSVSASLVPAESRSTDAAVRAAKSASVADLLQHDINFDFSQSHSDSNDRAPAAAHDNDDADEESAPPQSAAAASTEARGASAAEPLSEYQDENGDWITRHSNAGITADESPVAAVGAADPSAHFSSPLDVEREASHSHSLSQSQSQQSRLVPSSSPDPESRGPLTAAALNAAFLSPCSVASASLGAFPTVPSAMHEETQAVVAEEEEFEEPPLQRQRERSSLIEETPPHASSAITATSLPDAPVSNDALAEPSTQAQSQPLLAPSTLPSGFSPPLPVSPPLPLPLPLSPPRLPSASPPPLPSGPPKALPLGLPASRPKGPPPAAVLMQHHRSPSKPLPVPLQPPPPQQPEATTNSGQEGNDETSSSSSSSHALPSSDAAATSAPSALAQPAAVDVVAAAVVEPQSESVVAAGSVESASASPALAPAPASVPAAATVLTEAGGAVPTEADEATAGSAPGAASPPLPPLAPPSPSTSGLSPPPVPPLPPLLSPRATSTGAAAAPTLPQGSDEIGASVGGGGSPAAVGTAPTAAVSASSPTVTPPVPPPVPPPFPPAATSPGGSPAV